MIQLVAVLFALAIYFPIFGRIIPGISVLPTNLLNYGIVLALISGVTGFVAGKWNPRGRLQANGILVWSLGLLGVSCVFKLIASDSLSTDSLQQFRTIVAGLVYGGSLVFIFVCFEHQNDEDRFISAFIFAISVLFLAQGGLTLFESLHGMLFVDYSTESYLNLEQRDLLSAMGYDELGLFGFRIAFTGLMGQHNRYGGMLIFLNLLFLFQLFRSRNPYYLLLSCFCLLLAVGNTTKTAIFTIGITNAIILPAIYLGKRWIKSMVALVLLMATVFLLWKRFNSAVLATGGQASMLSRVDYWKFLLDSFLDAVGDNGFVLLWGMDFETLRETSFAYSGVAGRSFESDYIAILATYGAIGLLVMGGLLGGLVRKAFKCPGATGSLLSALAIALILSSATLDFNLRPQNLPSILICWFIAQKLSAGNVPVLPAGNTGRRIPAPSRA